MGHLTKFFAFKTRWLSKWVTVKRRSCSYVTFAFLVKRQRWRLWQQVMVFTFNICIFQKGTAMIIEKRRRYVWMYLYCNGRNKALLTPSNFLQIIVKALKMESVDPVTVTIRSGHDESEILILAPLWKWKITAYQETSKNIIGLQKCTEWWVPVVQILIGSINLVS